METLLSLTAALSFLAFIVGMFNPKFVRCASRGNVALIYLGIFIVCAIIGASIADKPTISAESIEQENTIQQEVETLSIGDRLNVPYANSNVEIIFKDIQVNRIPGDNINLVFTIQIKNNSDKMFFVSDSKWKLLDSEKIEVEESGIYEPMFGSFLPGMFFFTTVDPHVGKEEQVGYSVKEETYYLSLNGYTIAKIPLGEKH